MLSKQKELRKYQRLKEKFCRLKSDIFFLSRCKRKKIMPKFIQIKAKIKSFSQQKAIETAKRLWLINELKRHYAKMSEIELSIYSLHQELSNSLPAVEWDLLSRIINFRCYKVQKSSFLTKKRKLRDLLKRHIPVKNNITEMNKPTFIPNLVVNKSSVSLDDDELNLLNKGLSFAIPQKSVPIEELIVDIEMALKNIPLDERSHTRHTVKKALKNCNVNQKMDNFDYLNTIKSLNKKDIFVTKADKGNSIVVVDRDDYDSRMQEMIDNGPYKRVKNPLNKMKKEISDVIKKHTDLFGFNWKRRIHTTYNRVPQLYGLPKIHKEGNKYRPVSSNINAPAYNLSKWLVQRFNSLGRSDNFSIKNSIELANRLKNLSLSNNEVLVSFDIESYFPSVPIDKALLALQNWLDKQDINHLEREALLELTTVCMKQTYFSFRGKFYIQTDGTAMGNPLSPFICNLYINSLEEKFADHGLFPKTWLRYVDDVFAIVESSKTEETLSFLNTMCKNINFTLELEHNRKIPFLDLVLHRNADGKIDIDIHRKETATQRYITNDSNHHWIHKQAAFNSMIYRMCKIPLSQVNYEKELNFIYETAVKNGYNPCMIDSLIKKVKRKINISNVTSLQHLTEKQKFAAVNYHPNAFHLIKTSFGNNNVTLIPRSTHKLNQLLTSTKDGIPKNEKSGVYVAECAENDCNAVYIGQTRRELKTRVKEHLNYIRNIEPYKSGIAQHAIELQHKVHEEDFKLLKPEQSLNRLNVLESMYIHIHKDHNVNRDEGPFVSELFSLL